VGDHRPAAAGEQLSAPQSVRTGSSAAAQHRSTEVEIVSASAFQYRRARDLGDTEAAQLLHKLGSHDSLIAVKLSQPGWCWS